MRGDLKDLVDRGGADVGGAGCQDAASLWSEAVDKRFSFSSSVMAMVGFFFKSASPPLLLRLARGDEEDDDDGEEDETPPPVLFLAFLVPICTST